VLPANFLGTLRLLEIRYVNVVLFGVLLYQLEQDHLATFQMLKEENSLMMFEHPHRSMVMVLLKKARNQPNKVMALDC
jgi:hypothetical protein